MNRLIRLTVWLLLATVLLTGLGLVCRANTGLGLVCRANNTPNVLDDLQGVIASQIPVYDVSVTSPTWNISIDAVKGDK